MLDRAAAWRCDVRRDGNLARNAHWAARALVNQRLAACVQLSPIESV